MSDKNKLISFAKVEKKNDGSGIVAGKAKTAPILINDGQKVGRTRKLLVLPSQGQDDNTMDGRWR